VAPAWALAIDFSVEVGLFAPEFRASTAQGTAPVWTPHRIQLAATANLARAF
jgi:hypothetical protein